MHDDDKSLLNTRDTQAASTPPSGVSSRTDHPRVLEMATLSNPNNDSASTGPADATVTPRDRCEMIHRINLGVVVAALLVTVTFQAAVTPPGGPWQQDSSSSNNTDADKDASRSNYNTFMVFDILTFGASFVALKLFYSEEKLAWANGFLGGSLGLLGSTFICAVRTINPSPAAEVSACLWLLAVFLIVFFIYTIVAAFRSGS